MSLVGTLVRRVVRGRWSMPITSLVCLFCIVASGVPIAARYFGRWGELKQMVCVYTD